MRIILLIFVFFLTIDCATAQQRAGIDDARSGIVQLRLTISPAGDVARVEIQRTDAPEPLQKRAIAIVTKWRFVPARKDGVPVSSVVVVPIRLGLNNESDFDQSLEDARNDIYYSAGQLQTLPGALTEIMPHLNSVSANSVHAEVMLQLLINESGFVVDALIVRANPEGSFAETALKVFRETRFSPGMIDGRPVKSRLLIRTTYQKGKQESK